MTRSDVRRAALNGAVVAALLLGGLWLLHDVHGWGEVVFALVAGVVGASAELVRRLRDRRRTGVPDSQP